MSHPSSRLLLAAVGATALAALSVGAADASSSGRHDLAGSKASWATSAHRAGASDPATTVNFRVYLQGRDDAGAQAYAAAVSTPGSPQYRTFLTPAQYRQRFAPTASQVSAVKQWLHAQGLTVGYTPGNNRYVEAHGSLGKAATAFGTSFSQYSYAGHTLRSNDTPLSVPSTLGGVVAVIGLDDSTELVQHQTVPPAPVFVNAQPCSAYWGEKTVANTPTPDGTRLPSSPSAFAPCGYAGAQLQKAYGVNSAIASGNDGRGVTVAVIDAYASPTAAQDLETYSAAHGLPSTKGLFTQDVAPGTYNRATNKKQDPQGWAGEESLDLEAVHTTAPGANIRYVSAPNNYRDLDAALNHVVDKHSADIITNSYGYGGEALPQGYIKPQLDAQIQAATEGISVFFSSGDSGDETGGDSSVAPTPDWPASSPWVTAVGGTSLGVAQDGSRQFELGWETARSTLSGGAWTTPAYQYGSGGGTSRLFAQPAYQQGVVPDSLSRTYGGGAMRVVPDVSALGDPTTGMRVGQTQTFPDGHTAYSEYRIGGTSLASPLYAGIWALAVQKHGAYGLANPTLYAARGVSYDITKNDRAAYPGAVRVDYKNGVDAAQGYVYTARWFDVDEPLTIHVRSGYDDVTGVGSPNGQAWLDAVTR
ncbi:S53 family peptidase [Luteipulveratus flavus]|uniref:S53 family peptidase n=1 Tax=Luteipulveratus flavus TaxID=3031728 RepID=A0ABT6C7Y2_9MICO|nr:S53 family peptidase [Luteipulveratus sp. YIM 133296]MDF8264816.1 S53 family peptidase [Luteipulveratus sp. YIM 133296]